MTNDARLAELADRARRRGKGAPDALARVLVEEVASAARRGRGPSNLDSRLRVDAERARKRR